MGEPRGSSQRAPETSPRRSMSLDPKLLVLKPHSEPRLAPRSECASSPNNPHHQAHTLVSPRTTAGPHARPGSDLSHRRHWATSSGGPRCVICDSTSTAREPHAEITRYSP